MKNNNYIIEIALELLKDNKTIREVAKIKGISKSSIHKDLHEILPRVNAKIYEQVLELLEYNKKVRHLRGGFVTKQKYSKHRCIENPH